MNHAELEQLAAGYVLGALEPDDEHAFTHPAQDRVGAGAIASQLLDAVRNT